MGKELFRKFLKTLKPGGKLMISDYCLHTVSGYGKLLEDVGFTNVNPMNKTGLMIDIMKMELGKFSNIRRSFIEEFSEYDYNYIEKGWKDKVVRCNQGDQAWGLFEATKN